VQNITDPALMMESAEDGLEFVRLFDFSDRWKTHNVPSFLAKNVPDQVVFVQPLHDDHDAAILLAVEAAE
jgi:hypothetical protein